MHIFLWEYLRCIFLEITFPAPARLIKFNRSLNSIEVLDSFCADEETTTGPPTEDNIVPAEEAPSEESPADNEWAPSSPETESSYAPPTPPLLDLSKFQAISYSKK